MEPGNAELSIDGVDHAAEAIVEVLRDSTTDVAVRCGVSQCVVGNLRIEIPLLFYVFTRLESSVEAEYLATLGYVDARCRENRADLATERVVLIAGGARFGPAEGFGSRRHVAERRIGN